MPFSRLAIYCMTEFYHLLNAYYIPGNIFNNLKRVIVIVNHHGGLQEFFLSSIHSLVESSLTLH